MPIGGLAPEILEEALGLKELDRAGWLRVGVERPESVAAHSWGVAWLALVLCPPELDLRRVLGMAIVHDLPEVRVGDITPYDGVDKAEKHRREREAAMAMLGARPDLLGLWEEYEANETAEALFVHTLDKMDMRLQAQAYARTRGVDTSEFTRGATAMDDIMERDYSG